MVFSIVCYALVSIAVLAFVGSGRRPATTAAIAPSPADLTAYYALVGADPVCPDLTAAPAEDPDAEVLEPAPDAEFEAVVASVETYLDEEFAAELVAEFPAAHPAARFDGLHIFTLRALGSLDRVKGAAKWRKEQALAHYAAA